MVRNTRIMPQTKSIILTITEFYVMFNKLSLLMTKTNS